MNLLFLLYTPPPITVPHFFTLKAECSNSSTYSTPFPRCRKRNTQSRTSRATPGPLPARDRVIDFGKHKGKMLGSLPSNYLRWVSNNLRAREYDEWAQLADQVLQDPVYQDRIQWEFAQKVLDGDISQLRSSHQNSAVSELLKINERFGWDNNDKVGWSKIDFGLLGTSKGGRIPRISSSVSDDKTRGRDAEANREKVQVSNGMESLDIGSGNRKERRDRLRSKRSGTHTGSCTGFQLQQAMPAERVTIREASKDGGSEDEDPTEKTRNPFPGRESLLRRAFSRGRLGQTSHRKY